MNTLDYLSPEEAKKYRRIAIIKNIGIYVFLGIFALFIIIPFYWMIATSLKTDGEIMRTSASLIPLNPTIENFTKTFSKSSALLGYMKNTLIVAVLSTIATVATTIFAAFAFSRLDFKGKDLLFSILLATMMIPGEMLIITNFITVSKLEWLNSYQVLIIPHAASVFYIYFLRQTFRGIPNELYYAAKVDGKSDFAYLFKVMIPISKPTLFTITILSLIGSWNAYIWPRTVNLTKEFWLITQGLMDMLSDDYVLDNMRMAGAFVVSIPLLVLFICFKKYIMRGVSRSGIKG